LGSVRQTLLWLLENKLDLPSRRDNGDVVWRRPRYSSIYQLVANPAYGGAYAYGKTGVVVRYHGSGAKPRARHKAREEWLALQPGAHEGYVDWERAEAIRKMVSDNAPSAGYHGAPKHGAALLAGLLRCRRCGRKLTVQYTGAKAHIPRYVCIRGRFDCGEPNCIGFGGLRVDDAVEEALLSVVQPAAAEAALAAEARASAQRDQAREVLLRDLEATRYAADRAFRQYDAADPENRLVAGELEARWNRVLTRVAEVEKRIGDHDAAVPRRLDLEPVSFASLAQDLKSVWTASTTDARLKKRIVRTVIKEAIADLDDAAAEIVITIHWMGGVHTELRLPRRRRGQRNSTSADIVEAVSKLALIARDAVIAGILNRNGLKTGNGNRWTRERVTSLRSNYRIAVHRPAEDGVEPWLNLRNAAALIGVAPRTLRVAAERGEMSALHPLGDGPWIFKRADLEGSAAQSLILRVQGSPSHPTVSSPNQQDLFPSTTSRDVRSNDQL
ncbi:MAG TPA: recombinase family protein, partial [Vicinamibacterales bacterium]